MESVAQKQKEAFKSLKDTLGYENTMEAPRLEKVVISTGIGSINDKNKIELIQDRLARITGQKAAPRTAKKSIASFKIRQGDVVGYQVTLRGKRMHAFLDKLIHVAFPRTKDFRGVSADSIDEIGNITIGVPEHTAFPETSDEELKDVFGLAVTIVVEGTSSKSEAKEFLKYIGIPFAEKEE